VRTAFVVPLETPIRYPIAPVVASRVPEEAERFIAFVLSAEGQTLLRARGFTAP